MTEEEVRKWYRDMRVELSHLLDLADMERHWQWENWPIRGIRRSATIIVPLNFTE